MLSLQHIIKPRCIETLHIPFFCIKSEIWCVFCTENTYQFVLVTIPTVNLHIWPVAPLLGSTGPGTPEGTHRSMGQSQKGGAGDFSLDTLLYCLNTQVHALPFQGNFNFLNKFHPDNLNFNKF